MDEEITGLAELIKRGGIYRNIQGTSPKEVLSALVTLVPSIPAVPADRLLNAFMEREALMSTSIGKGIALPHPRNPLAMEKDREFTALAFLKNPINWNSLDGGRVDTLLLIVSASAKQHLHSLSEINYFCRDEIFFKMLKEHTRPEDILDYITEAEKNWK